MLEKMKSVSNPLTIIGLFCGVAEVVSLFTVARIAPELQSTFIWFVMGFPVLIVLLFFATLWRKDRVLYAPGDFKNEENYLALARVNAKEGLAIDTFREMLDDAIPKIASEVAKTASVNGPDEMRKIEEVVQDKLRPVQRFAGDWRQEKMSAIFSYLYAASAHNEKTEYSVWQLINKESRPLTLKEIASKLDLNEYAASTILYALIAKKLVKENPDEGNGITYSVSGVPALHHFYLHKRSQDDAT